MRRVLRIGFDTALRRAALVGVGFAVNVLTAFLFAAFAWLWLEGALQDSLATRKLLTDLDVNIFIDLFAHQRAGLQTFFGQGLMVLAIGMMAMIWVQASAALAVTSRTATLRQCLAFGRTHFGRFLVLWVSNLLGIGGWLAALGFLGRILLRRPFFEFDESLQQGLWGGGGIAALAGYLVFTTWHEHARLHCAAADSGPLAAARWALRFVWRRAASAFGLTVACLIANALLYVAYQATANAIPVTKTVGVTLSILVAQVWLLAKLFSRLWLQAAAGALQAGDEEGEGSSEPRLQVVAAPLAD